MKLLSLVLEIEAGDLGVEPYLFFEGESLLLAGELEIESCLRLAADDLTFLNPN